MADRSVDHWIAVAAFAMPLLGPLLLGVFAMIYRLELPGRCLTFIHECFEGASSAFRRRTGRRRTAAVPLHYHASPELKELLTAFENTPNEVLWDEIVAIMARSSRPEPVYSSRPQSNDRSMLSG